MVLGDYCLLQKGAGCRGLTNCLDVARVECSVLSVEGSCRWMMLSGRGEVTDGLVRGQRSELKEGKLKTFMNQHSANPT